MPSYNRKDWEPGDLITSSALDNIEEQVEALSNAAWGSVTTFIGATSTTNGISGLVPEAQIDERNKFLTGAGTWQEIESVNADIITGVIDSEHLPIASNSNLGIIKIGETLEIDEGVIDVSHSSKENFGCVKVGNNLEIDDGIIDINNDKILPQVSNADNKKILAVINGNWSVVEVQAVNAQVEF